LLVGCASFASPELSDKRVDRQARRKVDLAVFEGKRDDAQLAAASDRIEQGDVLAAEKLLVTLVERTPDHAEARLLLADLWVAQERMPAAEEQLRILLEQHPDNARAHHALGLLYDVTDQQAKAASHFRRAAELAPQDETFRLSLNASESTAPAP
jgi:Tfp pilus assembly protein PilF